MRQYLQGTLDYACGLYAVINALSRTHGLDLTVARDILREAFQVLPANAALWRAFIANETDHYWLVRRSLSRWCLGPYWRYAATQPFGEALLPAAEFSSIEGHNPYLPENEAPRGPEDPAKAREEAGQAWAALSAWFANPPRNVSRPHRVALLRFHRFLPGMGQPVVSHWTTVSDVQDETLLLHDASSEKQAIRSIRKADCLPQTLSSAMIRLVPESILLLERSGIR